MTSARYLQAAELEDRLPLRAGDATALAQHARLAALIEAKAPAAAGLFAEPVLDPKDSAAPRRVSWYGPASEDPIPLERLPTAQRLLAESELRSRLSALQPLLADAEAGTLVRAALMVPGQDDILWTGAAPVLVNWGIVPASVGAAPEALARHFDATLGRYAPPHANPWRSAAAAGPAGMAAGAAASGAGAAGLGAAASGAGGRVPPAPPPGPPPPPGGSGLGAAGAIAAAVAIVLLLAAVALAAGYYYGWSRLVERMQATLPPPRDAALDEQLRRAQESVNEGLRRRLAELEGALAGDVCVALGPPPRLDPPGAPGAPGRPEAPPQQPALSPDLIPPTAEEQPVRPPPGEGAPQATTLAALLSQSVVLVIATVRRPDGQQGLSQGSGFAVGDGIVVTNRHVIDNAAGDEVFVVNRQLGRVVRARIVAATDRGGGEFRPDLALLRLGEGSLPPLRLAAAIEPLQPVVAAGFPGFAVGIDDTFRRLMQGDAAATPNPVFTSGTVSGLQEVAGQSLVTHTASITRGNSGGPLADRCGRVVGVNTWGRMERDTLYRLDYAQPVGSVVAFLRAAGVTVTAEDSACEPAAPAGPAPPAAAPPPEAPAATPAPGAPAAPAAPGGN